MRVVHLQVCKQPRQGENGDARTRIGWTSFDLHCSTVLLACASRMRTLTRTPDRFTKVLQPGTSHCSLSVFVNVKQAPHTTVGNCFTIVLQAERRGATATSGVGRCCSGMVVRHFSGLKPMYHCLTSGSTSRVSGANPTCHSPP